jgi:hypothetical protein
MKRKEMWKPCPSFEKYYDISNYGNVRSYHVHGGKYDRCIKPSPLTIQYSPQYEYLWVALSRGIGVVKSKTLHVLVAKAFVPNPHNRKHAHHKDNDKTNPVAWNLEWVTPGQNQEYAYSDGHRKRPNGELNGRSKLNAKEVIEIFRADENHYKLASLYEVSVAVIHSIKNGRLWSSVTGKKYKKPPPIKKLSKKEVISILESNEPHKKLAKKYGISRSTVSGIKTGRSYSNVTKVKFIGKTEYIYYGIRSSHRKAK